MTCILYMWAISDEQSFCYCFYSTVWKGTRRVKNDEEKEKMRDFTNKDRAFKLLHQYCSIDRGNLSWLWCKMMD